MRVAAVLLTCLGGMALSPVLADPPDGTASQAAAAARTSEAAAPAAPAAATAPAPATVDSAARAATAAATPSRAAAPAQQTAPKVDTTEKLLLASGFKPEVQNGTTVWCRRVEVIGSRLDVKRLCGTPEELALSVREIKQRLEISQRQQLNPVNH